MSCGNCCHTAYFSVNEWCLACRQTPNCPCGERSERDPIYQRPSPNEQRGIYAGRSHCRDENEDKNEERPLVIDHRTADEKFKRPQTPTPEEMAAADKARYEAENPDEPRRLTAQEQVQKTMEKYNIPPKKKPGEEQQDEADEEPGKKSGKKDGGFKCSIM